MIEIIRLSVGNLRFQFLLLLCLWLISPCLFGESFKYYVADGNAVIGTPDMGYAVSMSYSGELNIPSVIGGYRVVAIAPWAFFSHRGITSVSIPEGVTNIDDEAFEWCTNIVKISLPTTLRRIGSYAFSRCEIRDINIPANVREIADSAFYCCSCATNVVMPRYIPTINRGTFACCYSIDSVIIPRGVSSIASRSFNLCNGLTAIDIPPSVRTIDENAFYGCTGLSCVYTVRGDGDRVRLLLEGSGLDTSSIVFRDEAMRANEVSLTTTNVVVHYVLNSVQPNIAVPVSGAMGFVSVITEVTSSGVVTVPSEWVTNYPSFGTQYGSDFGKSLMMKSGKKDGAGNAMLVWQDYVAGTDPTNPDDKFTASVTMVDGEPVVSWTPELPTDQADLRKYTTYGKARLQDAEWTVVNGDAAKYNFFKVTVEMK